MNEPNLLPARAELPPPLIYGKIASCIAEIACVGKDHKNQQQGYTFRSIDDFVDACNPVLARHRIFVSPTILEHTREERATKSGGVMMTTLCKVRFKIFAEDGSFIEADALGEGADSGDKSSNKSASQALKYMLQQVFLIRVNGDQLDTENDSPQYQPRAKPSEPVRPAKSSPPINPEPKQAAPAKVYELQSPKAATEATRNWFLTRLPQDLVSTAKDYAISKGWIPQDGGELIHWPLERVPTSREDLAALVRELEDYQKQVSVTTDTPNAPEFSEAFWDAVVTLPRAGTKRADYLQSPDTIRSLYDAMKAGDAKARARLFGVAKEWQPSPWVDKEGKERPPNADDVICRQHLDAFLEWEEGRNLAG